ncbi:hypothetical protein BCR41DRAFT_358710 [Lobosporangium transversale]|uniref:NDT80 domain-containing protein n=1 Tax=Lobosporangium transversale TaxID=64571 RepID=A0A1Y2GHU1_9FUNG|nr:hypothetical protein BCR41DRAFT_358710 [Lobosporangium transversale]ORZ09446.1 hypothetical protein BCR41DRAFT_358710 [Lobosporangium transversale]|eukprot:XP_021878899.1 hypothetical protein BCR41DRAFT_358710 [Lobosporangium transversale]
MPINGRDPSTAYSTSAPSPTSAQAMFANRTKRRSEVFAPHESPYFYPAQQHYNLCSMDRSTSYNIKIAAKIDRGFFLAANDWTCYRRNYFQISASFSIHGLDTSMHPEVPCLMDRNGEFVQVNKFLICIGAQIQNGEKAIELVQHTPKRDKGPQITPRPTPLRAGGDLSMYSSGSNPNVVTFERVQFKTATANNGKRRAAQQYYQVHVDLFAETSMGEMVLVARSFSAPLVVRGRSPGHYADNEENAGSATQPVDDRYYRNDSISSNGGTAPSVNGDYPYYPNYGYGSSYQYQSLGSASHIASQSDPNYYERHGSESSYPTSPLSPQARHPGSYMTPQIHHGFSPASVSPDMYSPPSFIGAGPESPINRLPHDGHYTYGSSPYSQYPQQQQQQEDAQGQYPAQYEPEDHEAQMAGLRIHSPVSPGSPVQASARRQSFSSSLSSKKVDRNVVGPARKPRSISMSGISKRAPSKTRPSSSRTVPVSPTKESMKGLGISTDRILEEEHQS